jgi:NADPH2 dehydrogenase
MATLPYLNTARLKNLDEFQKYIRNLGINLPIAEELMVGAESPLAQPFQLTNGRMIGNRFCIHPMEGWDGTTDGKPTELTTRRWMKFGRSGAKLIWGGEAAAVRPDGRANPNQLMILDNTRAEIEKLRMALVKEHSVHFGETSDLLIGLQLTHSGRFCRPNEKAKLEPKIVYHHPVLDNLFHVDADYPVLTDAEIEELITDYVRAAKYAQDIGFEFVDVKHCHGYLGHEFLSAVERPGRYGGSFENRTRFLTEIVKGIQRECPNLQIGVRVSIFDMPPFRPDKENIGQMLTYRSNSGQYPYAFGGDPDHPGQIKMDEPVQFIQLLKSLDVALVNFSAGSPYYNPHLTRPAYYPPSDGYLMPEDPLCGVARQIHAGAALKKHAGQLLTVGSGYTYLQDYLPNVAQAAVGSGMIDFVGLGRMVLSYPEMPADILAGNPMAKNCVCRTFSDCTTAPRMGLVSGCYPLDHEYKERPEAQILKAAKKAK